MNQNISRRAFLRSSRNVAVGVGLGAALPNIFLNHTKAATGENPSELVRVGCIAVGNQGKSNMNAIIKNVVAVCDTDSKNLAGAKEIVEKKVPGRTCATYGDYRKMLESKDIDAVLISTPDHWHALASADACAAGKDVYCEKPLTLTIDEGKKLVEIARKTKRVFQTGSQQRSDPKFLMAAEYIRNGRLGKIKRVIVGLPGVNWTKDPGVPDGEPPADLNYDMWLGPAPFRPYNKHRVHYYFRFFWDYSGGQMTNWGAHHLDITQWALGMDASGPVEITAECKPDAQKRYEVPETFHITYKYADGTLVECYSGYNDKKMGCVFEGDKGSLHVTRGNISSTPETILEEPLKDADKRLYKSAKHHANWLECIKTRQAPICEVAIGHRSATVCHLGNIAVRTGKKVLWDPAMEMITNDADLAKMMSRPYRAPWKFPTV
jgi:predicted dehydrogenase